MAIIEFPNGVQVDVGDNPSDEVKQAVARKFKELEHATSTPTTSAPPVSVSETPTSDTPPPKEGAGWTPTIVRTIGPPAVGLTAAAGVSLLGAPELAPIAYKVGSGVGGALSDIEAQREEIAGGDRPSYNPTRTLAEGATNTLFASVPGGNSFLPRFLITGGLGAVSNTAISISEGNGIPSGGQQALSFLSAGSLTILPHLWEVRRTAIREIAGTGELADKVETVIGPKAPKMGPDGEPTEIPKSVILDQHGKPIDEDFVPSSARRVTIGPGEAKQQALDQWMMQRRPSMFFDVPEVSNPPHVNEIPEGMNIFEEDGGMQALKELAGIHDMPEERQTFGKPSDFTMGYTRWRGRTKDFMAALQRDTGYPVFEDYDNLSRLNKKWQVEKNALVDDAIKAFRGVNNDGQLQIAQALMDPSGNMVDALPKSLRAKAQAIKGISDKALEPLGMTADQFWGDFLPRMNRGEMDALAEQYPKMVDLVGASKVKTNNPNPAHLLGDVINQGTFEGNLGEYVRGLTSKYSGNMDIPVEVRQAMGRTINALDGTKDSVTRDLGKVFSSAFAKFGLKVDGYDMANRMVTLPYSALLGARPGPVIRNAMQTIQTTIPMLGPRWTAQGFKQVLTQDGRKLVEQSGVAADMLMQKLRILGEGRASQMLDRGLNASMAPFESVEGLNRGIPYLGQRAKTLWAAEIAGGDVAKFITKSGISRFLPEEVNVLAGMYKQGRIAEVADRAGQILTDDTQFMYSNMEKPEFLRGSTGRYLGGFGNWALQYGTYLGKMLQGGAGPQSDWSRAVTLGRFFATNAALVSTFYGIGKYFGDRNALMDTLGWTFVAPAIYTGSPVYDVLKKGAEATFSTMRGENVLGTQKGWATAAQKSFFREAATMFIPGASPVLEWMKAREEPTTREAAGRWLGFKHGPVPKSKTFGEFKTNVKPFGQFGRF